MNGKNNEQRDIPALTATFRSQGLHNAQFPLLIRPSSSSSSSIHKQKNITLAASKKRAAPSATTTTTPAISTTIQELPPMYMLERNCLSIDETDSSTVSALVDRIVEFLRVQSISYTTSNSEDDEEATAAANPGGCLSCTTASRLQFVIQLWRKQGKIIMEVQRRQGCSIEMNTIRRQLIQQVSTSQADETVATAASHNHRQGSSRSAVCSSNKRPRTLPPQAALLNCQDALQISLRLIESHKVDQQQLGWESLSILTNPLYCSAENAQLVSLSIVQGEGALGTRLHRALANVLGGSQNNKVVEGDRSLVHHLALQTLANALERVSPSSSSSSSMLWQSILETLLRNLERAAQSPQEAAWSAKSIRVLIPLMRKEGVPLPLDTCSLQGLASKALDHGKARHLSLERETTSLLQTIL